MRRKIKANKDNCLQDITEHAKVEEDLRRSEERLRALVTASSDVLYRMSPDWSEMLQLSSRGFLAKTEKPNRNWLQEYIHPKDQPLVIETVQKAIRTKSIFELEHNVIRADGTLGWTLSRAVPVLDENGEIVEWFGAASDITSRKNSEAQIKSDLDALTRIHALSGRILDGGGLHQLLQETLNAAIDILCAARGNIQLLEGNSLRIEVWQGFEKPFLEFFSAAEHQASACGAAMKRKERMLIPDVEASDLFAGTPSLEVLRKAGVRAVQSTPIISRTDKLLGILSTHWETPCTPDEHDLWQIDLLARQAADLIDQSLARQALIKAKDDLEIKVKERTSELQQVLFDSQIDRNRLEIILKTIPSAVVILDPPDGRISFINERARQLYGMDPRGLTMDEHPKVGLLKLDGTPYPFEEMPASRSLLTGEDVHNEDLILSRPDGTQIVVTASSAPIRNQKGEIISVIGVFDDITKRKQVEESLLKTNEYLAQANKQIKRYGQRITQVQEEERKRIAYELHDDTAQYISILKMQINALLNSGEIQNPKILEKLKYLEQDADRAFQDVRRYSHELRPTVLEHHGLQAAIEQIADDFNKMDQLKVEVDVEGSEPKLSEEVKLGFFRIAQEALNNVRKHAHAEKAVIKLKFQKKSMSMTVADNGVGFEIHGGKTIFGSKGNLGLMSMRERADLIGAKLKIVSKPGKGTAIVAQMLL